MKESGRREEKTEEALQSEEKYRNLVENALVAVFQMGWDEKGRGDITYVNSTFLRLLGYQSLDEVKAAGTKKIFKDPAVHSALAQALSKGGRVADQEVQLVTKSGETVYWAIAVTQNERVMSGIARDVTVRKKAEAVIRQQLVFIEQLLDCVPVPVYYKEKNGIFLGCNRAYADFLSLPKERIIGVTVGNLFPHDIADTHGRADQELLETGGVQTYETTFPHGDGSIHDVIYAKATYNDADGNVAGIIGVIQDITMHKRAENLLRASETKYRTLFDHNNDSVFLIKDGVIADCSEKALATFKGSKKDIIGKSPCALSPQVQSNGQDSINEVTRMIEAVLSGVSQCFEWKHQRLNGEPFDSEVALNRIDLDNEVLVQAEVRDISERKRAQSKILESEAKHRTLVETSLVGMAQTHMDGTVLYVNEALLKTFDYNTSGKIVNVQDLITRRRDWHAIRTRIKKEGHAKNVELETLTRTGGRLTMVATVTCDGTTMTWMFVDITERRRMEQELVAKSDGLNMINTALKVLLDQRDKERREEEEKVLSNVRELVFPYLDSLRRTPLTTRQETFISTIEANLNGIISPFLKNIRSLDSNFTPTEIRVAGFIKDGRTTKEIADILGVSENAINFHRQHLRQKLGLKNEKTNLRSRLQSLLD